MAKRRKNSFLTPYFVVFVDAGMMLTMIRALGTAVESFFEPHGHHEK